jgi:hypothetical protein
MLRYDCYHFGVAQKVCRDPRIAENCHISLPTFVANICSFIRVDSQCQFFTAKLMRYAGSRYPMAGRRCIEPVSVAALSWRWQPRSSSDLVIRLPRRSSLAGAFNDDLGIKPERLCAMGVLRRLLRRWNGATERVLSFSICDADRR